MKRNHVIYIGIGLLLVAVFAIGRALIGDAPRSYFDEEHKEKLITELGAFIENPLTQISLRKENPWDKWNFEYVVSDQDKLQEFAASAAQADMVPLAGDNGPILGSMITLSNNKSELRLIATVHRHTLEDLYVSNIFPVETKPGTFTRGPGMEVRLPGLGRWIMVAAPVSCGEALRDKCATGELQAEDIK